MFFCSTSVCSETRRTIKLWMHFAYKLAIQITVSMFIITSENRPWPSVFTPLHRSQYRTIRYGSILSYRNDINSLSYICQMIYFATTHRTWKFLRSNGTNNCICTKDKYGILAQKCNVGLQLAWNVQFSENTWWAKCPIVSLRKIQSRAALQFYVHSMCKQTVKLRAIQIPINIVNIAVVSPGK